MTETQVTKSGEQTPNQSKHGTGQAVQTAQVPRTETTYVPNVDISESNECIRLVADMPGVDPSTVDVTVENNVLTVEGQARCDAPQGYELVGQEYGVGKYRRNFTLSNDVDTSGIKARVRHGVLEVTLPRLEEVKKRRIEIGG